MKISHYILSGFLVILLLFSSTTFINYRLADDVTRNSVYLLKSTDIIRYSNRFQRNILTMVDGLHGYLLTGEKSFIESYDHADTENDNILNELSVLLTDNSQKRLLKEIKQINDQWEKDYIDPLKKAKTLSGISPQNLALFNEIYKKKVSEGYEENYQASIKEKFGTFTAAEYLNRDEKRKSLSAAVDRTKRMSLLLNVIALIAAIAVVGFIVRKISRRITQLTKRANLIAAGNYDTDIPDTKNDELSSLYQSLNVMAAKLSKNIALLTKSTEQLHKFTFTISRGLKTPIRGIGNVISWIEKDHINELTPKMAEYIGFIKGRTALAENLIEGLLSYSRTGNEVIEKESVDVKDLINEIIENLPKANVVFHITALPVIYAERTLLFQIFSQLIGNAIKYNDKENGEIRIYYEEQLKAYKFFIKDSGVGIPLDYQEDLFFVTQPATEDALQPIGLGLAIVRKILESKNQQIGVVSKPGEGATFWFTWPKMRFNNPK